MDPDQKPADQNLHELLTRCSKCSKILNAFRILFSNEILVFKAGIYKMLVRIVNSTDPDQTASLFDLILYVHSTIFQLCGTGLPGLNQY